MRKVIFFFITMFFIPVLSYGQLLEDSIINTIYTSDSYYAPQAVACDNENNFYFAEWNSQNNTVIKKIDAITGQVTDYAGNYSNTVGGSGDGGPATNANLNSVHAILFDKFNNLYIGDAGIGSHKIRIVDPNTHIITTYAGTGTCSYSGDDGPATQATFIWPLSLALDGQNNLYIGDQDCRIRKIDWVTKIISRVAGSMDRNVIRSLWGEGGNALSASISENVWGLAFDLNNNLYLSDSDYFVIRKIDSSSWIINTIAGTGNCGLGQENVIATNSDFRQPRALAIDKQNNYYICEPFSNCIRMVDAQTNIIRTVVGTNGVSGHFGDGGPAKNAKLYCPTGVCFDRKGNMYLSDQRYIRKISSAPETPTGLDVTNVTCSGLTLLWNPATRATSYNIYDSENNIIGNTTGTSFNVSGSCLTLNMPYIFYVSSVNDYGESDKAVIHVTLSLNITKY